MPRALVFRLTILLFFGPYMLGQFSGLATTDDGSQLYFSSSLQLKGTENENQYSKIFRYDGTERPRVRDAGVEYFHLAAQVDKAANGATSGIVSNYYNLGNPYVSGDGTVTGYVGTADCTGSCFHTGVSQTTVHSSVSATIPGLCQISRNAQFALCLAFDSGLFYPASIINLITGAQNESLGTSCPYQPHTITSDGRAVLADNFGNLSLGSLSGSQMLNLQTGGACPTMISDDGSRIVAAMDDGSLVGYDVATGVQSIILTTAAGLSLASISNDGRLVLFLTYAGIVAQAAIIRTDGTGFLQLTDDPTGVSTAQLSGDGSTVFVVSNDGKLLKIDTTTRASSVLTSAAQVQQVQGGAVAGSLNSIQGAGLADATIAASTFPLTTSLGGTQVTIDGRPAPLLSVSPSSISFQIPWETRLGSAAIAVERTSPQFTQAIPPLQIQTFQPVAALDSALSQDFSQLNSPTFPAKPGDVLNFYLTGLGAVTAPVADGALSPSNPLPRLVNLLTVSYGSTPVTVFYAGLAPGQIGIYQLSVQAPLQVSKNPLFPNGGPVQVGLTLNSYALPVVWMTPNQ